MSGHRSYLLSLKLPREISGSALSQLPEDTKSQEFRGSPCPGQSPRGFAADRMKTESFEAEACSVWMFQSQVSEGTVIIPVRCQISTSGH